MPVEFKEQMADGKLQTEPSEGTIERLINAFCEAYGMKPEGEEPTDE